MTDLKRIPVADMANVLEKAVRYRLLNELLQTASICRDILTVDPHNQSALVTLLLALTHQFDTKFTDALDGAYEAAYYEGIVHKHWANSQHLQSMPPEFVSG